MIDIAEVTVLNDIRERLALITQKHLDVFARSLTPKEEGEKDIGVITLDSTRALFALGWQLQAEKVIEATQAMTASEPETGRDHEQRSVIADSLSDVVNEMQWFQARAELGFWKHVSLGIRSGWMLIEAEPRNPLKGLLARLQAGGL